MVEGLSLAAFFLLVGHSKLSGELWRLVAIKAVEIFLGTGSVGQDVFAARHRTQDAGRDLEKLRNRRERFFPSWYTGPVG